MLAKISSGAVRGTTGYEVQIEVHLGYGMVSWNMVGLPDGAVRESKVRVKSALGECGYDWPQRPIAVNLAPAGVRKDGTAFDLPMAMALLAADQRVPTREGAVLPDEAIHDVHVLHRFSFVHVDPELAERTVEYLDGTKVKGKEIRLEVAKS